MHSFLIRDFINVDRVVEEYRRRLAPDLIVLADVRTPQQFPELEKFGECMVFALVRNPSSAEPIHCAFAVMKKDIDPWDHAYFEHQILRHRLFDAHYEIEAVGRGIDPASERQKFTERLGEPTTVYASTGREWEGAYVARPGGNGDTYSSECPPDVKDQIWAEMEKSAPSHNFSREIFDRTGEFRYAESES